MISPATRQLIATLDVQWSEYFKERASILEFDGIVPRENAEEAAWKETAAAMLKARLAQRISALASHQRAHAKPVPLPEPMRAPILTAKDMAAGEVA